MNLWIIATPGLLLGVTLLAQNPSTDSPSVADGSNTADERLIFMRESMKVYEFSREGDATGSFQPQADPAFRLGRQGNLIDGAVFLITDEVGRPEVAIQPFLERSDTHRQGKWIHEFASLSTVPIVARRDGKVRWQPAEPGLRFQPVPDAPKPAATATARLVQMRDIAAEFRAEDNYGGGGYHGLRMLTRPIARYGKNGKSPEDGALFAFVEGTDSEAFLFIEVRKGADGPEWQYSLAPMGCWAVKASHKGREVWNLPFRSNSDSSKPLFAYQFWP
jgi:hypothetical protein